MSSVIEHSCVDDMIDGYNQSNLDRPLNDDTRIYPSNQIIPSAEENRKQKNQQLDFSVLNGSEMPLNYNDHLENFLESHHNN